MLGVVVAWGTNYTVVKEVVGVMPPLAFMSVRFAIASVAMLALLLVVEGWKPLRLGVFLKLAGLGLVGNTLYQLCFVLGVANTTAANSGLLTAATPVMVAALGAVLGVERLTRPLVMGLSLAVVGMVLVVAARGPAMGANTRLGDVLILGACACWAIYTVGIRSLGNEVSALQITAVTMLTGAPGVILAGLPAVLELSPGSVHGGAWVGMVYTALIPLVLGYFIWGRTVQQVGSARAALYNTGVPVVAALTAWAVRGERPTPFQALGAAFILGGVVLSRRK
ncbi:drug/metabolite exporter family protein [Myxococcus stipitatus DSM 14675]|uniref:Drug/metabolite exporter family protein n=1 Tax=Myxococcus stipitatus (strain DSM 14675 / JCM 12634 / Mx s8) TaxID=1278073 RepID=L7UHF9_MYXSD|nr:DMT family transporter [Myxococcus stipitatus]AGC45894.1 drug/metabolite exporter family protein [Myxococcus stipitatus DSM 14675]